MIKSFFKILLMLKYCLDRYNTQEMCDKSVDNFLLTLYNFLPIYLQMMIYSFLMDILVMSHF